MTLRNKTGALQINVTSATEHDLRRGGVTAWEDVLEDEVPFAFLINLYPKTAHHVVLVDDTVRLVPLISEDLVRSFVVRFGLAAPVP